MKEGEKPLIADSAALLCCNEIKAAASKQQQAQELLQYSLSFFPPSRRGRVEERTCGQSKGAAGALISDNIHRAGLLWMQEPFKGGGVERRSGGAGQRDETHLLQPPPEGAAAAAKAAMT